MQSAEWLCLAAIVFFFVFLHLWRMGSISPTWDEGGDTAIVDCIQKTRNPFACLDDISQTRLPFYIHALAGPAYGDERPHYLVSFVFSLATLVLIWWWARRRLGAAIAALAAALYVTSPQVLASGRMILTHSNIIFAFFTTASLIAALERVREGCAPHPPLRGTLSPPSGERGFYLCAVLSGLAAASHPLAVFNGIALVAIYIAGKRWAWRDLLFFPIAAATFFATTIIYLKPANFRALVDACLHGGDWWFWNYFGTGSPSAPWWFPFVVFVVKIGPWWLLLAAIAAFRARLETPLVAFTIAFFMNLVLKGIPFHYEAPHHQVQFYPLLFVVIAALLVRGSRWWLVAIAFAIQLVDVVRFFPNYLFYGSQYGERFIGEFYGPAVMHAQDKDPVNQQVDQIFAREPNARILVADHNALERNDPRIVVFSRRDPNAAYEYAFVDRLYTRHFHFEERDAFNAYVEAHYTPVYTYEFPPHVWMYRLLRRR